jgi:SAM-dependent methyltransferase
VQGFYRWCGNLNGRILDIGCGGGWPRRVFSEASYFGIDPIVADDRDDFRLIKGLGEFLPFKLEVFDLVLIMAALDHLGSLSMTFEECLRVLKRGGAIYIFTSIELSYFIRDQSTVSISVPKFNRFKRKLKEKGFSGLLKSIYYRIYYSKPVSQMRDNTHVRKIVLSQLLELLLAFPARLTIERGGPDHAFIKVVKIR